MAEIDWEDPEERERAVAAAWARETERADRAESRLAAAEEVAEALRVIRKTHADHEDRCLWCGKPWPCADYSYADAALARWDEAKGDGNDRG